MIHAFTAAAAAAVALTLSVLFGAPAPAGHPAAPGVVVAAADEPDVKVHHTQGCDLCGQTGQHTHTQDEWRALLDGMSLPGGDR